MEFVKRIKNEFIVFMFFPAITMMFSTFLGAHLYNAFLLATTMIIAFLMYQVIRWAFFDNKNRLGKGATGMWRRSYEKNFD